jgi:hypothetical protein
MKANTHATMANAGSKMVMGRECERGRRCPYCRTRDTTANAGSKTSRIKLWWISDYKDESFVSLRTRNKNVLQIARAPKKAT